LPGAVVWQLKSNWKTLLGEIKINELTEKSVNSWKNS